jgi:hypothetical protein
MPGDLGCTDEPTNKEITCRHSICWIDFVWTPGQGSLENWCSSGNGLLGRFDACAWMWVGCRGRSKSGELVRGC